MKHPIYQVDAFTDRPFAGNPAGVMPLKTWLPDQVLQSIAAEMNLAETAFFVPNQRVAITCAGLPRQSRSSRAVMQRWRLPLCSTG